MGRFFINQFVLATGSRPTQSPCISTLRQPTLSTPPQPPAAPAAPHPVLVLFTCAGGGVLMADAPPQAA